MEIDNRLNYQVPYQVEKVDRFFKDNKLKVWGDYKTFIQTKFVTGHYTTARAIHGRYCGSLLAIQQNERVGDEVKKYCADLYKEANTSRKSDFLLLVENVIECKQIEQNIESIRDKITRKATEVSGEIVDDSLKQWRPSKKPKTVDQLEDSDTQDKIADITNTYDELYRLYYSLLANNLCLMYIPSARERSLQTDTIELPQTPPSNLIDAVDINEIRNPSWTLKDGRLLVDVLVTNTTELVRQLMQKSQKERTPALMSAARLGLSSIVDLSSEFEGGMYKWFGQDWVDIKEKVYGMINMTPLCFEGDVKSIIDTVEDMCNTFRYIDARTYLYELQTSNHSPIVKQIANIYFIVICKFMRNPFIFVNESGRRKDLTEMEFVIKMIAPVFDELFADISDLVELRWGETVTRAAVQPRKIDMRIVHRTRHIELSHTECARLLTPAKAIGDRSKCLRTLKCVLDMYLAEDISDDAANDSTIMGLQFAGLEGQIIGIDCLDDGLYFGLEGPKFRFPAQLSSIKDLRNTLEALFFFKENINRNAKALPNPTEQGHLYQKIFHVHRAQAKHFKDIPTQQNLIQEIFQLVSKRPDSVCNFLEGSQMLGGSDTRVIYRHYATLYFVFVVDESESELGILDLIQVFVEGLDRCFENVCELDLIFHFEEVLETNLNEIITAANESNNKVKKRVGAMASITKSSAGAVARDLGANIANTATNVLQSTMSATLRRTGF
ncbi:4761_t:CDS:10 [Paraglomus brasilianum]|uniref:4761_t:CDS:1 n=1 Tax=Paraglomus brasilianum TaxID=144538 RepID=A0A9N8W7P7_9GLOM|nr:4761_t:CDS:10 [Paraglomus brasilianum]